MRGVAGAMNTAVRMVAVLATAFFGACGTAREAADAEADEVAGAEALAAQPVEAPRAAPAAGRADEADDAQALREPADTPAAEAAGPGPDVPSPAARIDTTSAEALRGASAAVVPGSEETGEQTAPAQAGQDARAALRAAGRAYEAVTSMRAGFRQTLTNPLLGRRMTSAGTLYQRQPDRFLLSFTDPAGDVILADGRYFWVYYPSVDARQVIRMPAAEPGRSGIDLRAQFIGDPVARFEVLETARAMIRGRDTHVLTLSPRDPAGYQLLKVWIDFEDHLVRTFEITDQQGVMRRFELEDLVVNVALPDSLFRFTPPPDARIIDRG